jgi:hypothetical protein
MSEPFVGDPLVFDAGPCPGCCNKRKAKCCGNGVARELIASILIPGGDGSPTQSSPADNGGDGNHHYPPIHLFVVEEAADHTVWRGTFDLADGETGRTPGGDPTGAAWGPNIPAGLDAQCDFSVDPDTGEVSTSSFGVTLWCGDPSNVMGGFGDNVAFVCDPFYMEGFAGGFSSSCGNLEVNNIGGSVVAA